jgi:hypothetical protein
MSFGELAPYHRHMGVITVRQARAEDAKAMARTHVQAWRELSGLLALR